MGIETVRQNLDSYYPCPRNEEAFNMFIRQDGRDKDISIPSQFDLHFASYPVRRIQGYVSALIDTNIEHDHFRRFILGTIYRAISNADLEQRALHPYEEHFDSQAVAKQLYENIKGNGTFELQRQDMVYDISTGQSLIIRNEDDEKIAQDILQNKPETTLQANRWIISKEMYAIVPSSILHQLATELYYFGNDHKKKKRFATKILSDLGLEVFLSTLALSKHGAKEIQGLCDEIVNEKNEKWFESMGIVAPKKLKALVPKQGNKPAWSAVEYLCSQLNSNIPEHTSHSRNDIDRIRRIFEEIGILWNDVTVDNLSKYFETVNLPRFVSIEVYLRGLNEVLARDAWMTREIKADPIALYLAHYPSIQGTTTSEVATIFSQDTDVKNVKFYYPGDKALKEVNLRMVIEEQIQRTQESRLKRNQ